MSMFCASSYDLIDERKERVEKIEDRKRMPLKERSYEEREPPYDVPHP